MVPCQLMIHLAHVWDRTYVSRALAVDLQPSRPFGVREAATNSNKSCCQWDSYQLDHIFFWRGLKTQQKAAWFIETHICPSLVNGLMRIEYIERCLEHVKKQNAHVETGFLTHVTLNMLTVASIWTDLRVSNGFNSFNSYSRVGTRGSECFPQYKTFAFFCWKQFHYQEGGRHCDYQS